MKASLQWMNEYVPMDMNRPCSRELADQLTQAGIPVEDVIAMDNGIKEEFILVKSLKLQNIQMQIKLQVCQVGCLQKKGWSLLQSKS